jgi:hypothetical protein
LPDVQLPPAQTRPQLPQLRASVWRFTQVLPQVFGRVAGQMHWPFWQTWLGMVQEAPQAPQLVGSVARSAQRSAAAQNWGREVGQAHAPPLQIPPVRVQRRPHPPQFT